MFVEAVILGFIIGIVRNGRMNNFLEMKFKAWGLIVLAFLCFLAPYVINLAHIPFESPQIFTFAASVITLIIALINISKPGMKIFLIGGLLNIVIMALNHFMMPVNLEAMSQAGLQSLVDSIREGSVMNYIGLDGAQFLSPFLGKVIILPEWYPLNQLISVGDIIMSVGIMLLVQGEMLLYSSKKRGSMLSFTYTPKF